MQSEYLAGPPGPSLDRPFLLYGTAQPNSPLRRGARRAGWSPGFSPHSMGIFEKHFRLTDFDRSIWSVLPDL